MKTVLIAAAAAALLAACDSGGAHHENEAVSGRAAVVDQIRAEEAQWNRDYAARDAVRLAGHYAEDATLMEPGAPPRAGREAIRAAIAAMVADPNFQLRFESDRIEVARSGELAYSRGHYSLRLTNAASRQPENVSGSYLTVWRQQADGSWKAVEDMIVGGPAEAPPGG